MPIFHQSSVSDIVHVIIKLCYYSFVGREPPWHEVKGIIFYFLFFFYKNLERDLFSDLGPNSNSTYVY